ncbi:MAG: orotidine-5'-phosphate decarboxylase, partial [Thermoanaerobaculia bacterium]|nr:orotidine-5'-phosphate decarboxylase [Thermoanaerobaculia bacterium]
MTAAAEPEADPHGPLFSDRLFAAVAAKASPVVVGLDPHLDRLPAPLRELAAGGREDAARAVRRFADELLEAIADTVAIVKPQVAFFERLGPAGWQTLEHVVARAHELGLLVLADAKRGDIGSTAQAYADYFLGSPDAGGLGADALTVSPYLGPDTLAPFAAYASRGRGVFVLAKTSNPGSVEIQDLPVRGDDGERPLWSRVGRLVDALGRASIGDAGYASLGLVVGATGPEQAGEL